VCIKEVEGQEIDPDDEWMGVCPHVHINYIEFWSLKVSGLLGSQASAAIASRKISSIPMNPFPQRTLSNQFLLQ